MSDVRWFGDAGHFIAASQCRFHLHTHVNGYCVSTVGAYFPVSDLLCEKVPSMRKLRRADPSEPAEIGCGRTYETMVFPLGLDGAPSDWSGIDFDGYTSAEAADAEHALMVDKYARASLHRERDER